MINKEKEIIIAVPKGRILKEAIPILKDSGIQIAEEFFDPSSRKLKFATDNKNISVIRVRSFDVANFVAFGGAHIGIVGQDVILEFNYKDIFAPVDLKIGTCRLSLAESKDLAEKDDPATWSHVRVATKYPEITKKHFAARGVQAECIKLNGALELAPALGMCRRIVDLVSTGDTLKENGLKEVEKILDVSSKLIVNRIASKTRPEQIGEIVSGIRNIINDQ